MRLQGQISLGTQLSDERVPRHTQIQTAGAMVGGVA